MQHELQIHLNRLNVLITDAARSKDYEPHFHQWKPAEHDTLLRLRELVLATIKADEPAEELV